MKRIFALLLAMAAIFASQTLAQQTETFDVATYQPPKGWTREASESTVQFLTEDKAAGTYCVITLYRSVPSLGNPKENFDAAWGTLVKEAVNPSAAPTVFPSNNPEDWKLEGGYAPFQKDGIKGVVILLTASGHGRMINIMILTNGQGYDQTITQFVESISLKKPAGETPPPVKQPAKSPAAPPAAPARKSGFKFNTSNFDDGWTSTEQEDWVEAVKGNIKVLIHYPRQGTIFPADPAPLTNAAWDILVAPRYSNLKNYKTSYISTYERPLLGMGYVTERASGKEMFVVLFRKGNSGWIEFVAPDKRSFINQFKVDPETIQWDSETALIEPLLQMVNYNKFAVAESDFSGTWTNDFTGVQQLYSIYTGSYAGMNIHQSKEQFIFGPANSYRWELLVVSGMVGDSKFSNAKSAGKFSVPNNWQITFSKIESGPKTYNAFWSCIKGARLLHLLDAKAPGNWVYSVYGKK